MIIVSTPKGMNHYYKMWMDADRKSDFMPIEVHWSEVPGVTKNGRRNRYETLQSNSSDRSLRQSSSVLQTHLFPFLTN